MSMVSIRLSRALEGSRPAGIPPRTRAELVRLLLARRAAAAATGCDDLDELLRAPAVCPWPIEQR